MSESRTIELIPGGNQGQIQYRVRPAEEASATGESVLQPLIEETQYQLIEEPQFESVPEGAGEATLVPLNTEASEWIEIVPIDVAPETEVPVTP